MGAHLQPWTFVAISNDVLQSKIRVVQKKRRGDFTKIGFQKPGLRS